MLFDQITLLDYGRPLCLRKAARQHVGPYTWQPAKPNTGRGFYQSADGLACDERGATFRLRLEYAGTHCAGFPRSFAGDSAGCWDYTPIIARLPHGRGFLAGWTLGEGMAASLDSYIYEDAEEASRAARNEAEHVAESEREYEAEQNERARMEDAASAA